MKRFNYIAFLAAVVAAVSCEVSEPMEGPHDGLVSYNVPADAEWSEFIFTSESEGEDSRTVHSGNTILWSTGDQIRMGYTVNGAWQGTSGNASQSNPAKLYASEALATGGPTASFRVPGNFTGSASGTYSFYTVYPASAAAEDFTTPTGITTTVTIPTVQTPAAASFDPAADLMIGQSVAEYSSRPTEPIPLSWKRKVAHGEITLKNLNTLPGFDATKETIQSVTLTAQSGAALTGTFTADLTSPEGALTPSDASNSVTVSGANLSWGGTDAEPKLTFWISILPGEITSLDIILVTKSVNDVEKIYSKTYRNISRTFKENAHNTLGISMKNYYVKVTAEQDDWSGDYLIVYEDGNNSNALDGSLSSIDVEGNHIDVTILNNKIEATSTTRASQFTVAAVSDGYSIQSAHGEYIGHTGSKNTLNTSSSAGSGFVNSISYTSSNGCLIYVGSYYLRFNNASTNGDRYRYYSSSTSQQAIHLYKLDNVVGATAPVIPDPEPDPEATATVTTGAATNKTKAGARLNGSFEGSTGTISEVGFRWGTTENNMDQSGTVSGISSPSDFYLDVSGLSAGTTYYFKAYVKEYNARTEQVEERCGSILNFTTDADTPVAGDYELVTTNLSDWSGQYVLVYTSTSQILNGFSSTSTTYGTGGDVTITNDKIAYDDGKDYELTIEKSGNYYTILLGNKYLGWTSGNSLTYTTDTSLSDSYKWSISYDSELMISNAATSGTSTTRYLRYNAQSPRFACYTSGQQAPSLFKRSTSGGGTTDPEISVTTVSATSITNTLATLNGSYSIPSGSNLTVTERGFYWGTSSTSLSSHCTSSSSSTSFSKSISNLEAGTTYWFKAYVIEKNTLTNVTNYRYGNVVSFTTTGGSGGVPTGWLELPATTGDEDFVGNFYGSGGNTDRNRNYSYCYSYTWYASMWVAWPLCAAHTSGSASTSSWRYNPDITPNSRQVNIVSKSYGTMYGNDSYARGHQCPNADRKSDDTMNLQTYYSTNQTPQLQNKFNGSIWGSLETATRNLVSGNNASATMVYVATGPVYRKVGGSETISYLTGANSNANPSSLAIPNYYWKALLKVQWDGDYVTSASAIGFWFDHREYASSEHYYDSEHIVSVDQIEQWTGLDLFTNLPDGIEATAESNASWSSFQSFIGGSESAFQ